MLVDDSRSSLFELRRMAEQAGSTRVAVFSEPEVALAAAAHECFDIVVVDYIMPMVDGIEFTKRLRRMPRYARVPIVMLTSSTSDDVRLEALEAGATDFLSKSCDVVEFQIKLRNLISMADATRKLDDQAAWLATEVEAATNALLAREEEIIFRLSLAVEYRDNATGDHTLRVARYSRLIAEELGLSPARCRAIYLASPLHDVGKVAVPDHVLLKPGSLDAAETKLVHTHAEIGARILGESSCHLIQLAAEIAGGHHERWDGKGYPKGLAGEAIPLTARIVAVADVFDALTSDRAYKKAMPRADALAFIREQSGLHFDPACVTAFLAGYARLVDADAGRGPPGADRPLEAAEPASPRAA
jgi:putative two-component system response regulator